MKYFSPKAFEHLLFKLHNSAYRQIDLKLQEIEGAYPGTLKGLCTIFDLNFSNASSQGALIPPSAMVPGRPSFDVNVRIDESVIRQVAKCDGCRVDLVRQPADLGDQRANSNHLVLGLKSDTVQQCFIVPLPLVLQAFEERVCKPNTYQVYQHNLIRKQPPRADGSVPMAQTLASYMEGTGMYVGITSRTWQQRFTEHLHAARRGSLLRFHQGLAGNLFDVHAHEHIVLRAGLNRPQALHIEEVEVEERTLHATHPNGLNMIPGGEAGLRFLSTMTKRSPQSIRIDEVDTLLERVINRGLPGAQKERLCQPTNSKMSALWQKDTDFRISAITNQSRRMSHQQIIMARIWFMAGWLIEKIHEMLQGIDGRTVSLKQVKNLLEGKTYTSIPYLMPSPGFPPAVGRDDPPTIHP